MLLLDPAPAIATPGSGSSAVSQTPSSDGVMSFTDFASQSPSSSESGSKLIPMDTSTIDMSKEVKFSDEFSDDPVPAPATEQKTEPEPEPQPLPEKKSKTPKFEMEDEDEQQHEPEPEPEKQKQQKQPTQQKLGRNYDGLPEEVAALLKELHNNQYNKYRELLPKWYTEAQRAAELEQKLQQAQQPNVQWWYDNPNAYILTDEFAKAQQEYETANFEQQHWQSQLEAIENGDAWREIVGYNQQGQPQYKVHPAREDGRVDSRAKAFAVSALSQLGTLVQNAQAQLGQVQAGFKQRAQQENGVLQQIEDKVFSAFTDITKLPQAEQEFYKQALQLYPAYMQKHPAVRHVAKAYLGYQRLADKYSKQSAELNRVTAELQALKGKTSFAKAVPSKAPPQNSDEAKRMAFSEDIDLRKLDDEFSG